MTLKEELLGLLERDKEFRYAVAGLIGLEEILKRLDRHEEILMRHEEILLKHSEELLKLREDTNRGFELLE
ncbi:MAG: hypothetical protein QXL25_05735, partial [Candidatus Bathyarchaeia archaeon]